jgi:broad specificity phosphatase PhoE
MTLAALFADNGKIVTGLNHGLAFSQLLPEEQDSDLKSGFLDIKTGKFFTDETEFYIKQFILIRHAHHINNQLTPKGISQTQTLINKLKTLDLNNYQFFSSPAPRCIQTANLISQQIKLDYQIDNNLNEKQNDNFFERIENLMSEIPPFSLLVTHSDVIRLIIEIFSRNIIEQFNHASCFLIKIVNSKKYENGAMEIHTKSSISQLLS